MVLLTFRVHMNHTRVLLKFRRSGVKPKILTRLLTSSQVVLMLLTHVDHTLNNKV